jgi:hypothetical protein
MIWDGTTTVHDKWGTAPTTMFPVEIQVKLNVNADSITVYSLTGTGAEKDAGVTYFPTDSNTFTVLFSGLTGHTPWFGIKAFGHGLPGQVPTDRDPLPKSYLLEQNYPNPFNPTTGVRFQVSGVGDVKLTVYDLLGREVAVLVNERKQPGMYEVTFDGRGLSSGSYVCRMTAGPFVQARKMLLIK